MSIMISRKVVVLMAAIAVFALLAGCTSSAPSEEKKVAIFSGHQDWAPIMSSANGNNVGIGPNVTKMVFATFNVKVECKDVGSWDVVQEKAKSGEIDGIVGAYWNEERAKYFLFSVPYATDDIALFFPEDKGFTYVQKEDLIGKKGIATTGDSYGQEMDKFIIQTNLNMMRVDTPEQAFAMLKEGKADYFIYSASAGRKVIAESHLSGFKESGTVSSQPFYILVSKNSQYAKDMYKINSSLEVMIAKGNIPKQ